MRHLFFLLCKTFIIGVSYLLCQICDNGTGPCFTAVLNNLFQWLPLFAASNTKAEMHNDFRVVMILCGIGNDFIFHSHRLLALFRHWQKLCDVSIEKNIYIAFKLLLNKYF